MINGTDAIPESLKTLNREEVRSHSLRSAAACLKVYDSFAHKGTRGHAALIAGSYGMMGASVLATKACSKSGIGKVSAFIPEPAFQIIHHAVPEAIVHNVNAEDLDFSVFQAIGIGPGLGTTVSTGDLLEKSFSSGKPLVVDADALNYLSLHPGLLKKIPRGSILTPHLLEWERLFGHVNNDRERIEKSISISNDFQMLILTKGHYSCLTAPGGLFHINGTGNSGMGKAGSGDVLTGLLAGLLGQGYSPEKTAILGMCIHGLAGDFAKEEMGEDAMTAADTINCLSKAFMTLRN